MEFSDEENEDDGAILVDNEVSENPGAQDDFHGVISPERKKYFIEPAAFLLCAGNTLYEILIPNTVELQYCRTVLNLTQDQCFSETLDIKMKEEYEKFASTFAMYRSFIEVGIPFVIVFFVGSWSDTYGRKPLMLSALIGYSVTHGLWTFGSSIPSLPPLYFLFFSLPQAFSGGNSIFVLGLYCYVCDATTLENRGVRLGRLQIAVYFGSIIANQSDAILLPLGSTFSYGLSTVVTCLALFYVYFFLDESVVPSQVELNPPSRNPFNLHHIRDLYEYCFTKQTPKLRFTVFLIMLIIGSSSIDGCGEGGMLYLYLQRILNFDLYQYIILNTFQIIVNALAVYGGTWLLCQVFQLNDLLVLSMAAFSRLLSALVMIFGYKLWHIYFAKLLSCTSGISSMTVRAFLSRIVAKDELGKVFSLLESVDSSTPLVASLLYSRVFNLTVTTMPGAVFYLSAFLLLFMLACLVILVKMYVSDSTSRSPSIPQEDISNINSN